SPPSLARTLIHVPDIACLLFAAALLLSDGPHSPVGQYAFGVLRNTADDLASRRDIVNEPGILPHRQHGFLDVATFARRLQCCLRPGWVLTQRPFPPRPSLDEPVAPRA